MSTKVFVNYSMPNFEKEWDQAEKYFEFKPMGKKNWISFAKNSGKRQKLNDIQEHLQNADPLSEYCGSCHEIPIVVKFSNENYEIVGGNQKLQKLNGSSDEIPVWVLDLSNLMFCI